MDEDAAFRAVQQTFLPGAVTIVGSGFACSFGMPGMPALATHLLREVPPVVAASTPAAQAAWATIASALARGEGLEAALASAAPNDEIASIVAEQVGDAVADAETDAIRGIIEAGDVPALGRLLVHIAQSNTVVDVITTNYDRIIEYCAGLAGLLIDTMFCGDYVGFLDPEASSNQMLIPQTAPHKRGQVSLRRRPHVHLCKPHGSLDWYEVAGRPIRSDVPLRGRRLIVAPGDTKYRAGYEKPFDAHRERANHAIDRAASLIVVGYGFNDDHLQTHLKPKVAGGTPTVIVARTLSAKAREYLALSDAAVGIEQTTTPATGTTFYRGSDALFLPGRSLWELTSLAKEVLAV